MGKDKIIMTMNSKRELHGYQEWYNSGYEIELRGTYRNHLELGYEEYHSSPSTNFYIR